jgi:hypothetical protein
MGIDPEWGDAFLGIRHDTGSKDSVGWAWAEPGEL